MIGVEKRLVVEGKNNIFGKRGEGKNFIFGPKYRPLGKY
jgi:hypothetical protein